MFLYDKFFKVVKPCQLTIFNKLEHTVVENLEDKGGCLVSNLKYNSTCILLLQLVDTEDSSSLITTPGCKNICFVTKMFENWIFGHGKKSTFK